MLTPPSKGTPIDLEFIGQMVTQLNSVENALRGETTSTSYIGNNTEKTFGKVKFYTTSITITPGAVDANTTPTGFGATFPSEFKYAPFVTVSVKNTGKTSGGNYVTATLLNVTTSAFDGVLTYAKPDNPTLDVIVIAIGIAP